MNLISSEENAFSNIKYRKWLALEYRVLLLPLL
jgi:hypothetical protein